MSDENMIEEASKVIASIRGVTAHINKRDRDEAQALSAAGLLADPDAIRKAKAEVWEEGHEACALRIPEGIWHDVAEPHPGNPYRESEA